MKRCKACSLEIPDNALYCHLCGKKQIRETTSKNRKRRGRSKTGNVRKLPSGKYQARIENEGTRVSLGTFETAAEANFAILEYATNMKKHLVSQKSDYTLGQVYKQYLNSVRYQKLTPKGKEGISSAWGHLCKLEKRKMKEIDKAAYEDLIANATSKKRYKKLKPEEVEKLKPSLRTRYVALENQEPQPLSRESKMKIRNLVKLLCEEAIGSNIISVNYGSMISVDGDASDAHGIFTDDQIESMFTHTDDERVMLVLIFIYMGWRPSALLQMEKSDVHLNTEDVERGNYPYGYCIGGIKTEEGKNREVPIHKRIRPFIEHFMLKPGKKLIIINNKEVSYDYYLRYIFPSVLKTCGINNRDEYGDKITPHSTRNTFALMLFQSGVKPEIIAKLMGHTSFDVTNKKYIRARQSRQFTADEFSKMIN